MSVIMAVFRQSQQRNREDSNIPAFTRAEVSGVWERFCVEAFRQGVARKLEVDPVAYHLASEEQREKIRVASIDETIDIASGWADRMTVAWAKAHGIEVTS